ncbi:MAG: Ppx/GppA family phosphatase [Bdellovibrionales bacterium]|nr:Ppx/GppA family phosphatase [Bdellovibrionales bacterium]
MRVAIIDLGTNSVRFDVHQIGSKNQVRLLHREKLMVRLGQGVFSDGKLNAEAIRRTLHAFVSFRKTADDFRVERVVAFGTAALREASDGARLLNLIREKSGIEIRVISGVEEAKLIALGVLRNEKTPKGRFGLIDIGGGSTEISIVRGKKLTHANSFSLGTARLQQVFLRSSPPKPAPGSDEKPIAQLRSYVRAALLTKMLADRWPKVDRLVGSSGTVRAIGKLIKKGKASKVVERPELKKLVKQMSSMTTTELLGMPGMEAKRVDMILAGAILLEECMNVTGAKKVFATDYSLRDGILEEQLDAIRKEARSGLSMHLADVRARVEKVHPEMVHLDAVTELAGDLFDRTRALHKLPKDWKPYLTAAALLHDIGEVISPTNHEVHSYYFAKNADFTPLEKWESEFIARLCLYHRVGKPELEGHLGKNGSAKERKHAFVRLLALLRIADALDRNHRGQVGIGSLKIRRQEVLLTLRAKRGSGDLELLRIEQKKTLFEEVFRRRLTVRLP